VRLKATYFDFDIITFSEGAGVMSGGASEIKDIPMAEHMAYGTLGMQQEEGKDVSVSQCLAGGQ